MIGLAVPRPGSAIFHRTLLVSLQFMGGWASGAIPLACGPRQAGQLREKGSAASLGVLKSTVNPSADKTAFMG